MKHLCLSIAAAGRVATIPILQLKEVGQVPITPIRTARHSYLKFKGNVKAEAKIWPDHKYREYEIVDKNLRRVGFVMQLKANQRVDIEVSMLGEID